MVAFNRLTTLVHGRAQDSSSAPYLFRYLTYFNCAFTLLGYGLLLIGNETELQTLTWIALVCIAVGSVGWLVGFVWMTILVVQDIREMIEGGGSALRGLFNRGGNHQVDSNRD